MGARSRSSVGSPFSARVNGVETVEIKVALDRRRLAKALRLFGVTYASAERRHITFFDEPQLPNFEAGLILRSRRRHRGDHDATVKLRPVAPGDVPPQWRRRAGFKIEADAVGDAFVTSASLTRDVEKGLVRRVETRNRPASALFDAAQQKFIVELAGSKSDLAMLQPLGPIEALWWRIEHEALPWPFVLELWRRPDGATIVEVSLRAPMAQAPVVAAGFAAFLSDLGAGTDADQTAKTRWALDYFAAKLATGGRRKRR